jgi:hypothetical protein
MGLVHDSAGQDRQKQTGKLTYNGKPVAITQANQAVGAGAEILLSHDERMILASNRQAKGHQNDYLTTFEVDSGVWSSDQANYV